MHKITWLTHYRKTKPEKPCMGLRENKKENIPMQVVEGNRILSSVGEILTKWKNENEFARLLAELSLSVPAWLAE